MFINNLHFYGTCNFTYLTHVSCLKILTNIGTYILIYHRHDSEIVTPLYKHNIKLKVSASIVNFSMICPSHGITIFKLYSMLPVNILIKLSLIYLVLFKTIPYYHFFLFLLSFCTASHPIGFIYVSYLIIIQICFFLGDRDASCSDALHC